MSNETEKPVTTVSPTINPATSAIVTAVGLVVQAVNNLARIMQRRENISPGLFRITPDGSPMGKSFIARKTRIRAVNWVIAVDAAGTFGIQVGSAVAAQVEFGAADTKVIPLEISIDNGMDVTTTGTAANVVDSFLLGFSE